MADGASRGGRIAFIGFGEAGRLFAEGIAPAAPGRAAWDLKLASAEAASMRDAMTARGVAAAKDAAEALAGAEAAFCLVTADQAVAAAEAAEGLAPGALWLDGNSCAPEAKRRAAQRIEARQGRYADVAIMAPVHPQGIRVPLLVSGPHAEEAAEFLRRLGMHPRVVGPQVGQASAIKMLRSVVIKGLEAITAECLVAARAAGVDAEVLASLQASDPGWDWAARGAYNLERMASHGLRRAAEMREVASFLADLGLPADMAGATVAWQERLGALGLDLHGAEPEARADLALAALRPLA
ncbi:NAD(P)-dependent oxidoreductase [Rubellimicrobium aerolatum]|uniref:DUF1932 domain-containing protein n=1 Tax=Rubellimicrobium aerolatum TaxID=490979 RepID=A0ABW0SCT8_9RHOB|nr:NAD(P)-dependent oxidoreductase [Rubellimicrobium aerolatum]MBP1806343.1 3-hydroxyisobutyrate dehydrogenase-like beta-hydroxyacid dehydrogenase [Rubellimicrobium aerolatum]